MTRGLFFRNRFWTFIALSLHRHAFGITVFLVVLLLSLIFKGGTVQAAVTGLVAKCDNGIYHQYDYEELLDSYALQLLGSYNGLYEDYVGKKKVAARSESGKYVDYKDILDHYARALLAGEDFDPWDFVNSGTGRELDMPGEIILVALDGGRIERTAKTLPGRKADPGKTPPIGDAGPEENLGEQAGPNVGSGGTPILGEPTVTLDRARAWARNRKADQVFIDIASLYWHYGAKTGIRPEVLYAQAALETGFGRYGGAVPPQYNNWAGIKKAGATGDNPVDHEEFATPEDGVRAHFNHMSAYIGMSPIGEPHGRYYSVIRLSWAGTVQTVEELSGKWAPSPAYHERIIDFLAEMMIY